MGASRNNTVGMWAAVALLVVGVVYLVVVGYGVSQVGTSEPIVDPILAVMEILTLASAPLILVLLAAIHGLASQQTRIWSLIAFGFGLIMAGLTSAVHFVALTAGRQTGAVVLEWPSASYAVELLAWDVFLGLALIFAAPVFQGTGLRALSRWALNVTGGLCLAGTIGPIAGDMPLQRIGILGYGLGLPLCCLLIAMVFREDRAVPIE